MNNTLEQINKLNYGYGYMGNNRTFKSRYNDTFAMLIINHIPKQHRVLMMTHKTQKTHIFIGIVAHRTHVVWTIFERAVIAARGEMLSQEEGE
jgi:hypothetical protein